MANRKLNIDTLTAVFVKDPDNSDIVYGYFLEFPILLQIGMSVEETEAQLFCNLRDLCDKHRPQGITGKINGMQTVYRQYSIPESLLQMKFERNGDLPVGYLPFYCDYPRHDEKITFLTNFGNELKSVWKYSDEMEEWQCNAIDTVYDNEEIIAFKRHPLI